MIKVKNLNKSFIDHKKTIQVLNNINFTVNDGEIFGIIGRSGAGKSTLIKCLNLLEMPDSGTIEIDNVDITQVEDKELRSMRKEIGVIFQNFNLLNSKSVFENIALPLILRREYSKDQIKNRVFELLELVELTGFENKYPQQLSGGQKQRVGIARALATKPKLLLSDEATSALDPQTTRSILDLLLSINKKLGITIILITHEIDVVRKICDQVAVLDSGIIVENKKTIDLILHPEHELTKNLIIEEESTKFLEEVEEYYKFEKNTSNSLVLITFVGEQTFQPILSQISREHNTVISILHGDLRRIKNTPYGQLLVEIKGGQTEMLNCLNALQTLQVHYRIIL
jgi:D-methionine transport system ATP-binding protein